MKNKFLHGLAALALALGLNVVLTPLTDKIRAREFSAACSEAGGYVNGTGVMRLCVREKK